MGDINNNQRASVYSADLTGEIIGEITETDIYFSLYKGYGVVWRGVLNNNSTNVTADELDTSSSVQVAIKALRIYKQTGERKSKLNIRLHREVQVWGKFIHKNIVPLLGTTLDFVEAPSIGMVSPWMENGNLTEYLKRHDTVLRIDSRLDLLSDVAAGLHYLHKKDIIHGDLTGGNVLINDAHEACLIDFGLSSIKAEFEATSYWSSTVGGALRWRAPELMASDDPLPVPTFASDVYSFGCIMLQTLSGKVPFDNIKSDLRVAFEKYNGISPARPKVPPIENVHWNLISECWGEASTRPSIDDIQVRILEFRA